MMPRKTARRGALLAAPTLPAADLTGQDALTRMPQMPTSATGRTLPDRHYSKWFDILKPLLQDGELTAFTLPA